MFQTDRYHPTMKTTYYAGRIYIWLTRAHRCRGFGIQSPSDYSFVRYVVNEHWPYYAYSLLRRKYPDAGPLAHRLGRLYFRVANHRQPATIADIRHDNAISCSDDKSRDTIEDIYTAYMHAGCRRAVITHDPEAITTADLIRITLTDDSVSTVRHAIATARPATILILEGIHRDSHARRLWHDLRHDSRVRISFDLHYAGIMLFTPDRYQQHYTICF